MRERIVRKWCKRCGSLYPADTPFELCSECRNDKLHPKEVQLEILILRVDRIQAKEIVEELKCHS